MEVKVVVIASVCRYSMRVLKSYASGLVGNRKFRLVGVGVPLMNVDRSVGVWCWWWLEILRFRGG